MWSKSFVTLTIYKFFDEQQCLIILLKTLRSRCDKNFLGEGLQSVDMRKRAMEREFNSLIKRKEM